jgi:polysaccharide pyruvyl transferase WcaK-like protein
MGARRLRVGLLGATFHTHNRGVSALTEGAIKSLLAAFPDARVTLLDYGREPVVHALRVLGRPVEVDLLPMRFSRQVFLPNHIARLLLTALLARLAPFGRLRRALTDRSPVLRRIAGFDLAASLSGGDSFSDLYGMRRFLYMALPQLLVLLMGRKLVLLPQTLGPYRRQAARALARLILRKAAAVYSRDHEGLRQMRRWLGGRGRGRLRFCFDVGFVLDPAPPDRLDLGGLETRLRGSRPSLHERGGHPGDSCDGSPCLVGLNVSGLLYMGGYTRDNMFRVGVDYPRVIDALLDHLLGRPDIQVLLVPHVFGGSVNPESDAAVCAALYGDRAGRAHGRLFLARGEYSHSEVKYIIGLCDFFVGSRMHACIAALSQGVPAVGLAYSRKFAGVFESLGLGDLVADLRRMETAEVLARIDALLRDAPSLRRRLQAVIPGVHTTVLGLFQELVPASQQLSTIL